MNFASFKKASARISLGLFSQTAGATSKSRSLVFLEDGPVNRMPQLNALVGLDTIFIKLADWEQLDLAKRTSRCTHLKSNFTKVEFFILEDLWFQESAASLLLAETRAGRGIVVRDSCGTGQEVFHVVQPPKDWTKSKVVYGLIKHISGATLYQIDREIDGKFCIWPMGASSEGGFDVFVKKNLCSTIYQKFRLVKDERRYELQKLGTTLAVIRERAVFKGDRSFLIHFRDSYSENVEVRCLALGFALLKTLTDLHSDLSDLLRDSIKLEDC